MGVDFYQSGGEKKIFRGGAENSLDDDDDVEKWHLKWSKRVKVV